MKTTQLPAYVRRTTHRKPWSKPELTLLTHIYPDNSTETVARELRRSKVGVIRMARLMGLHKSAEYLTRMGRKNIRSRWA